MPADRILHVYSLSEIAAEKIMALADSARNEPRDLYDLWYLTTHAGIDVKTLIEAIRAKLKFRGKSCEGLQDAIIKKEVRLKSLWTKRLEYQMAELPPFDAVFRAVQRMLRQAEL